MKDTNLIEGGIYRDERGKIVFANDFNMAEIQRLYHIHQSDISVIRAWQGHKKESKWFHCIKGSFLVYTIPVDNWSAPNKELQAKTSFLNETKSEVLHIPGGYANGFKALEEDSILMVFSDFTLEQSKEDDIRFDKDYWDADWTKKQ
ncbi:MAG: dTDP-4-dehydrorhamnose 3,5-epimerase family protein [Saprospiraceae bacterium]